MRRTPPFDLDVLYAKSLLLTAREDFARQFEEAAAMYDRASRLYNQCAREIERSRSGMFGCPESLGSLPRSPWFREPESVRELVGRPRKLKKPAHESKHRRQSGSDGQVRPIDS
jgi:uncharacterized protein with von Willebrand factor type A (vWA) domain